jgi:hypothetical protein
MDLKPLTTPELLDLLDTAVTGKDHALRRAIGAELRDRPVPDESMVERLEAIMIKDLKTYPIEELISRLSTLDFEDPVFGSILDEIELRPEPSEELQERMMSIVQHQMMMCAAKSGDHLAAVVEAVQKFGDQIGLSVEVIEIPRTKH